MNLFLSFVDRLKILEYFHIRKIGTLSSRQLDIIYVILRLSNKIYDSYLSHIVMNIYLSCIRDMVKCYDISNYDLLFDQLTNDMLIF